MEVEKSTLWAVKNREGLCPNYTVVRLHSMLYTFRIKAIGENSRKPTHSRQPRHSWK